MTETADASATQDDNQRAFLRYLPKRIAAFEKRILRYRIDGWDPDGMAVLSGDLRRLADASSLYGLAETRRLLQMLAEVVGEHFASMRAPDPQQVKRMFAMLSAVIRSAAVRVEPQPRSTYGDTAAELPTQAGASQAPPAEASAAPVVESMAPVVVELMEAEALVARVEAVEPVAAIEPAAPVEPEATIATDAMAAPVEAIEPNAGAEPDEAIEPVAIAEPVETIEMVAAAEPVESIAIVALVETIDAPEVVGPVETLQPIVRVETVESIQPIEAVEVVEPARPVEPDEPEESETTGEGGMRRVYHLSDGNPLASELGQRLESEGYAIEPIADLDELSELLLCLMPQLLLVDASHLSDLSAIGILRRDAQQRSQPQRRIQMVVMAAKDTLETRRAAHRAGADLLLFAPFDIADLSARLQALYSSIAKEKVRVLIVEDNRADALFAQTVLTRAGMQAHVELDPMQVLETLKAQRPDLVLMDLHMPFANGVEVTMLIREHPLFARLPIVFLSGESDPDSRLEAINAGGDDFLFKPIRPRHLIAAVQDRVRRMHPVNRQDTALEASE